MRRAVVRVSLPLQAVRSQFADAVLERARGDFDAGEYRWVVQVLHHVAFDDPQNRPARELAAAAMEQLGHEAESATRRNAYLLGASELRHGHRSPHRAAPVQSARGSSR